MVLIKCENKDVVHLDEGLVKTFRPYRIIQKILGSCRVHVTNRVVRAPTAFQKCYTIICLITSVIISARFVKVYSDLITEDVRSIQLFAVGYTAISAVFTMSILHCRFFNNEENIELYKRMQNIDSLMKINSNDCVHRSHYKLNIGVVLTTVLAFSAFQIVTFFLIPGQLSSFEMVGAMWNFYCFVFELYCCSSHIVFFINRVKVVNSLIINHFRNDARDIETLSKRCTVQSDDFESSETDVFMKEIFNGFSYFSDQYRFQVIVLCYLLNIIVIIPASSQYERGWATASRWA